MTARAAVSLHARLAMARSELAAAGIPQPDADLDVELFARSILNWDRARLLTEYRSAPPDDLEPRLTEWIARRKHGEPTAYITGVRQFWELEFHVTPDVLIPRPETEFIVEEALPLLRGMNRPRAADIGTGSGCLAVSLAYEIPACQIVATDISARALEVAKGNARTHGVEAGIEFRQTRYLDGIAGSFDLIVSNPPYVKDGDKSALGRDVRHEPEVALFGGDDGLRDIEHVLNAAAGRLVAGGWFLMEFGYGQDDDVRQLVALRSSALRLDRIRDDLQGIPRTAVIQRISESPA